MNRGITLVLLIILVFGAQAVFAQIELPEPVWSEAEPLELAEVVFVPGFWFTDLYDVSYLWAFDPANAAGTLDFTAISTLAAAASSDAAPVIPNSLRNNRD
jgi:hypothetical protein